MSVSAKGIKPPAWHSKWESQSLRRIPLAGEVLKVCNAWGHIDAVNRRSLEKTVVVVIQPPIDILHLMDSGPPYEHSEMRSLFTDVLTEQGEVLELSVAELAELSTPHR